MLPTFPVPTNWADLLYGGVVGAILGVVFSNIMWPRLTAWTLERLSISQTARRNSSWDKFNALHPTIILAKAGPDPDGTFPESSFDVTLDTADFKLSDRIAEDIRVKYDERWRLAGLTDDEKAGFKYFRATRISDSPADFMRGKSHLFVIRCHRYKYFDFLATHRRLVEGQPDDLEILHPHLNDDDGDRPVEGFPNPFSVGLTLFCESGRTMVLTIRTTDTHSGGDWQGGKRFNAVGENANTSDFQISTDGKLRTTPYAVARRGLHEEMGFTQEQIDACQMKLHSFAWATDIRDHKFFGWAQTDLARGEIEQLWRSAKDRGESRHILFVPVATHAQCVRFWQAVLHQFLQWSPEAFFCTSRTLLVRGMLRPSDLASPPSSDTSH